MRRNAVALLDRLQLVRSVDGGVLVLPPIARFRGVVVNIRDRSAQSELFHEPVSAEKHS